MAKSLQDQLLQAGLISNHQAKKVKSDKRKQIQRQRKNKVENVDENKINAQKNLSEKVERDLLLNKQKAEQAEQKAIAAQIRQLVEMNRQAQDEEGLPYHFEDLGHVKTLYLSKVIRDQIVNGRLAIVKLDKRYEVVATEIAEKISQRDNNCIILQNTAQQDNSAKDDPYADFQVPDDLMW